MLETNLDKLTEICRDAINSFTGDIKEDFAEYLANHLSENKAVILPFKLGDKLYQANSWNEAVDELTVSMITQKKDGTFKIRASSSIHRSVRDFTLDEISNPKYCIFCDKASAVEAHKQLRDELMKQSIANLLKLSK